MDNRITDEQNLVSAMVADSSPHPIMLTPQVMMSQLILSEFRNFRDVDWRDFRGDVSAWRDEVSARLTKVESSVKTGLDGNGQPSRLALAEHSIDELKKFRWQVLAIVSAISSIFAFIGWAFPRNGLIGH